MTHNDAVKRLVHSAYLMGRWAYHVGQPCNINLDPDVGQLQFGQAYNVVQDIRSAWLIGWTDAELGIAKEVGYAELNLLHGVA